MTCCRRSFSFCFMVMKATPDTSPSTQRTSARSTSIGELPPETKRRRLSALPVVSRASLSTLHPSVERSIKVPPSITPCSLERVVRNCTRKRDVARRSMSPRLPCCPIDRIFRTPVSQIEVLQLPLDAPLDPVSDRMKSEDRFLAVQEDFLDPSILPSGTSVTLVEEVLDSKTLPFVDVDYEYLGLRIHHLTLWVWSWNPLRSQHLASHQD